MKPPIIERSHTAYPFFPSFLWAGAVATLLMLGVHAGARAAGLPIAGHAALSVPCWAVVATVLMLGAFVLPLFYVYALYFRLPGPPALKGMTFGATLWMIYTPFACAHAAHPAIVSAVGLASALVYGVTLGKMARRHAPEILALRPKRTELIDDILGLRVDHAA